MRQLLTANYIFELPFGKGKQFLGSANPVVDRIVSGWSLGGITTFEAGYPLGMTVDGGNNLSTNFGAGTIRPNVVAGVPKKVGGSKYNRLNEWFNTAAFAKPGDWSFGNESANDSSLRQDGVDNWDINVGKSTAIKEGISLQFRGELFNLFNHPQFAAPNTSLNSGSFGIVPAYQANSPRIAQFSLRLNF